MKWNHFIIILLLDHYFKIKDQICRGILGVLVKILLNLISFSPIFSNFLGNENLRKRIESSQFLGGMKIWDSKKIEKNKCFLLLILFPLT